MKKELRQRALAARNALEKREEKSRQIAAQRLAEVLETEEKDVPVDAGITGKGGEE